SSSKGDPKRPPIPVDDTQKSKGDQSARIVHAQAFLHRFGYLTEGSFKSGVLDDATSRSLHAYQEFSHLRPSGIRDRETVDQLLKGRCGMPDVIDQLRFVRMAAWDKMDLTFAFGTQTSDVAGTDEFQAVRDAFQTWAAVIPVTFREVSVRES